MILPCPHCKKHFRLNKEHFPKDTVRLKCPACEGIFALQHPTANRKVKPSPRPAPSPSPHHEITEKDQTTVPDLKRAEPRYRLAQKVGFNKKAILLSVIILVAVTGAASIISSKIPPSPEIQHKKSLLQAGMDGKKTHSLSPSLKTDGLNATTSFPLPITKGGLDESEKPNDPLYQTFRSFTAFDIETSCEKLNELQTAIGSLPDPDRCRIYPPWIAYLTLETAPVATCKLEPVFGFAINALENKAVCSSSYAFLSAYYIYKRITDRSKTFLSEALHRSENDPWVKIVEAFYYQKIQQDPQQAINILSTLKEKQPGLPLIRYHLARLYMEIEDYEKASTVFKELQEKFPDNDTFIQIQKTLLSIQEGPYYSRLTAKSLMDVGQEFIALRDYDIAGQLTRKVLREMPAMLSKEQRKLAYYELGQIYEIKGDNDNAYAAYLNTLKIDPAYHPAREKIRRILNPQENI